ncbi:MAG: hypothetical protein V5A81_07060, partial [Candidatus Bipolaricaulota bacterium]
MGIGIWSNKYIAILITVALLVAPAGARTGRAQGTSLEIEGAQVKRGDKVTLTVTITRALDGLGRLDAAIVSGNPDVFALTSLTPRAVSEEFLQIDLQEKNRIKFKLVDLRKKVSPGDENVELLTFTGEAANNGTSKLSLVDIKYTDEEGNIIEPAVKEAEITVEPAEAREEESPQEKEKEQTNEVKEEPEGEKGQAEGEKGQAEGEPEREEETGPEPEPEEKVEVEGEDYSPI